jgi:hypothetical protein
LRAAGFAFNASTPEEISEKHTEIFDPGLIDTFGFSNSGQISYASHAYQNPDELCYGPRQLT